MIQAYLRPDRGAILPAVSSEVYSSSTFSFNNTSTRVCYRLCGYRRVECVQAIPESAKSSTCTPRIFVVIQQQQIDRRPPSVYARHVLSSAFRIYPQRRWWHGHGPGPDINHRKFHRASCEASSGSRRCTRFHKDHGVFQAIHGGNITAPVQAANISIPATGICTTEAAAVSTVVVVFSRRPRPAAAAEYCGASEATRR